MVANPSHDAQPVRVEGDWDKWDERWQSVPEGSTLVYVKGKPRYIRQLRQRCYFEDLWRLMPDCEGAPNCLELGAGKATTSTYLASRNCQITLVDLARHGLEIAQQNFSALKFPEPNLVVADVRDTGLPSNSFDCVYSIGLLEHFLDPVPVLKESLRVLRPGGVLYSVIIPPQKLSHSWPLRLPLNPVGFSLDVARRVAKGLTGRKKKQRPDAGIRTDFSNRQWVQWMAALGQPHAECLPYNPYHVVYRNEKLNDLICMPAYRLHHRLRSVGSGKLSMKTWPWLSVSQLLLCQKQ